MVRAILRAEASIPRAGDGDLDELARPLAVPHQLLGEIQKHGLELVAEVGQARVGRPLDQRRAALAGGEDQQGVVGGAVAIHRDAVEGFGHVQV